ncbi:MAG: pyridoxal phosphate-dependent aminotransferase [Nitrospinae bacterium]|nr:pyridoxal phosphate-dependent aminotransferase [Nitrospinota bacterium]
MELAKRLAAIKPSPTLEITAKAKAMKAQGLDIVGFGAGEPDFDTPEYIKKAAIEALNAGKTKYTDTPGIPELRDALTEFYKKTEGLEYKRGQTIFSSGGKHTLYNLFMTILSPGDEVIIPTPYWVSYPDMVMLADGKPVFLHTKEENGFLFAAEDLQKLVTPKTKAIVVNSPSNPSGAVYDEATLKAICAVAVKHGILVVWDEIYKDIYYGDGKLRSLPFYDPSVKSLTIIVSGLSKAFSMTGWRLGWALGDEKIINGMNIIQGQSTSNPVSFAQYGALAALREGLTHLPAWVKEFRERRDRLVAAFNEIPGMKCLNPMGAFYVFPNVSGWFGKTWSGGAIKDSYGATKFLLEAARCAVVPGDPFGAPENIRLSYALSMDEIEKGISRIKEAVVSLK